MEPYLLLGLRIPPTASPHHLELFAAMVEELEQELVDTPMTELMPAVYIVELPDADDARAIWLRVAQILTKWDARTDDEVQWFAHLADRRGCELASH